MPTVREKIDQLAIEAKENWDRATRSDITEQEWRSYIARAYTLEAQIATLQENA
jgi:hypothetical protein